MCLRSCSLLIASCLAAVPALAESGNVPEGMWSLDQAHSKELSPGAQSLWIIKDDGKRMAWVNVSTDPAGQTKILSWNGAYDGESVEVLGAGMKSQVSSKSPGTVHNQGEIPGVGSYSEDCFVRPDKKHFICDGQVSTPNGPQTWHDDFVWVAKSPYKEAGK